MRLRKEATTALELAAKNLATVQEFCDGEVAFNFQLPSVARDLVEAGDLFSMIYLIY